MGKVFDCISVALNVVLVLMWVGDSEGVFQENLSPNGILIAPQEALIVQLIK